MRAGRSSFFRRGTTGLTAVLAALVAGAAFADAVAVHVVSQRGREFHPGAMSLKRGDILQIVNDDGDLLHHAYVDADGFSFDSGDQPPGSKTPITFTKSGVFNVLCGIHPKMKMVVTVKD